MSKYHCYQCGHPIQFVGRKGTTPIRVEPGRCYFVPLSGGEGETFVTPKGDVRNGRQNDDGLLGYRKHECPYEKQKGA